MTDNDIMEEIKLIETETQLRNIYKKINDKYNQDKVL
jgi:hypothetical protein